MRFRYGFVLLSAIVLSGCAHASSAVQSPGSVVPQIVQTGSADGWQILLVGQVFAAMARGHDGAMWGVSVQESDSSVVVGRVDMAGHVTTYRLGGVASNRCNNYLITPNPDGNVYVAEDYLGGFAIAKVTPQGNVTDFPIPGSEYVCGLVTGSDGNLWMSRGHDGNPQMSHIARMTIEGQYIDYSQEYEGAVQRLIRGPDKNVWGVNYGPQSGGQNTGPVDFVRINVSDGSSTTYHESQGDSVLGADGAFWGVEHQIVSRFDPENGQSTTYRTNSANIGYDVNPVSIERNLYWLARGYIYSFSVVKHTVVKRVSNKHTEDSVPFFAGLDGQLWIWSGNPTFDLDVYILHPIIPFPSTISIGMGESTPLNVHEKYSFQKSFTAASADSKVATVSGAGESFTVTGLSVGNTTITVSDKIGNSLDVPVTVH